MMGLLTGFGSASRAGKKFRVILNYYNLLISFQNKFKVGPIVVTLLYESYGHRICFIFLSVLILLTNILIAVTYKRYKPYSPYAPIP